MKINTRKFGEIEIDEKKILTMPEGLPGFPGFERFILIEDPKTAPFCWFQSINESNLALIIMNPFLFKQDYQIDLEEFIGVRGWQDVTVDDLLVYVVLNIIQNRPEQDNSENTEKQITANLIGPLIINSKNNEAIQVAVSNSSYSHQYNILEDL
ncbi:flagellar assembly protein FliW [bacterium]|nr:flagellar assembly protein FliW [bacterium]